MGLAQIKMPQLGESVTEGTVDHWLKNEGDFVKRDEPIVEVVTDKVNAEIPSPFEGKLVKITAAQGETVLVGSVIAQIEVAGAPSAPAAPAAKPEPKAAVASGPAVVAAAPPAEVVAAGGGNGGARLSPAVRKLSAEHNLDPTTSPTSCATESRRRRASRLATASRLRTSRSSCRSSARRSSSFPGSTPLGPMRASSSSATSTWASRSRSPMGSSSRS